MNGFGNLSDRIEHIVLDNLGLIRDLVTERVGAAARGAVDDEQVCRLAATRIYPFLPLPIRRTVGEMEFADRFWKDRHAVFAQQRTDEITLASGATVELAAPSAQDLLRSLQNRIELQRHSLDEMASELRVLQALLRDSP
jgi:hypothetical protein